MKAIQPVLARDGLAASHVASAAGRKLAADNQLQAAFSSARKAAPWGYPLRIGSCGNSLEAVIGHASIQRRAGPIALKTLI